MARTPAVTIITATLNRPGLVDACRSVDCQTFRDWRHYIVGDGVTPTAITSDPRRRVSAFKRPIGSRERAVNMLHGTPNPLLRWALAHLPLGTYVCFLDDDNIYRDDFLEQMVDALERAPKAGLALCAAYDLRRHRFIPGYPRAGECDNSAFLARRAAVKKVEYPYCTPGREAIQDCEFIQRVAGSCGWTRVPDPLLLFSFNDNPPPRVPGVKVHDSWSQPVRALELLSLGYAERAIADLSSAFARDEEDAWTLWHLAEAQMIAGRRELGIANATRWVRLVRTRKQDWVQYRRSLVAMLQGFPGAARGHLKCAIRQVRENIKSSPDDVGELLNLSLYLLLPGKNRTAEKIFSRAVCMANQPRQLADIARDLQVLRALGLRTRAASLWLARIAHRQREFPPSLLAALFLLVAGEWEGCCRACDEAAALVSEVEFRNTLAVLRTLAAIGRKPHPAAMAARLIAARSADAEYRETAKPSASDGRTPLKPSARNPVRNRQAYESRQT